MMPLSPVSVRCTPNLFVLAPAARVRSCFPCRFCAALLLQLLLGSLHSAHLDAHEDLEIVDSAEQLLRALRSSPASVIALIDDLNMLLTDWPAETVTLARDVTLVGYPKWGSGGSNKQAVWVDLNWATDKLHLAPGTTLYLENLALHQATQNGGLTLLAIDDSPNATVVLLNSVIIKEACIPPSSYVYFLDALPRPQRFNASSGQLYTANTNRCFKNGSMAADVCFGLSYNMVDVAIGNSSSYDMIYTESQVACDSVISQQCINSYGAEHCLKEVNVRQENSTLLPHLDSADSSPDVAAILSGSIIGGVLLLALLVFIVYKWRKAPPGSGWKVWATQQKGRRGKYPGAGPATTFAVTDIENSSSLWENLPSMVMDEALKLHHACIRKVLQKHDGTESATEGDSFILVFHTCSSAALFSLEVQAELMLVEWPASVYDMDGCKPVWAEATVWRNETQLVAVGATSSSTTRWPLPQSFLTQYRWNTVNSRLHRSSTESNIPFATPSIPGSRVQCMENGATSSFTSERSWLQKLLHGTSGRPPAESEQNRFLLVKSKAFGRHNHSQGRTFMEELQMMWQRAEDSGHQASMRSGIAYGTDEAPLFSTTPPGGSLPLYPTARDGAESDNPVDWVKTLTASVPSRRWLKQMTMRQPNDVRLTTSASFPVDRSNTLSELQPAFPGPAGPASVLDGGLHVAAPHMALVLGKGSRVYFEVPNNLEVTNEEDVRDRSTGPEIPDKVCIFDGLRVRIGIHSGLENGDSDRNRITNRQMYGGQALKLAKMTGDRAHGGMIILSEEGFRQLVTEPTYLSKEMTILHLGDYLTKGRSDGNKDEPIALYQVLRPSEFSRLLFFPPVRAMDKVQNGTLDAPVRLVCIVFMYMVGYDTLRSWSPQLTAAANLEFSSLVTKECKSAGGYVVELADGFCLAAFKQPRSAFAFGLDMKNSMMQADWDPELLRHELCEELKIAMDVGDVADMPSDSTAHSANLTRTNMVIARGPRIKVGIDFAQGEDVRTEISPATGRMVYRGRMMNRAARIASSATSGKVFCSSELWQLFNSDLLNSGTIDGEEMGNFQLKGIGSHQLFSLSWTHQQLQEIPSRIGSGRAGPCCTPASVFFPGTSVISAKLTLPISQASSSRFRTASSSDLHPSPASNVALHGRPQITRALTHNHDGRIAFHGVVARVDSSRNYTSQRPGILSLRHSPRILTHRTDAATQTVPVRLYQEPGVDAMFGGSVVSNRSLSRAAASVPPQRCSSYTNTSKLHVMAPKTTLPAWQTEERSHDVIRSSYLQFPPAAAHQLSHGERNNSVSEEAPEGQCLGGKGTSQLHTSEASRLVFQSNGERISRMPAEVIGSNSSSTPTFKAHQKAFPSHGEKSNVTPAAVPPSPFVHWQTETPPSIQSDPQNSVSFGFRHSRRLTPSQLQSQLPSSLAMTSQLPSSLAMTSAASYFSSSTHLREGIAGIAAERTSSGTRLLQSRALVQGHSSQAVQMVAPRQSFRLSTRGVSSIDSDRSYLEKLSEREKLTDPFQGLMP